MVLGGERFVPGLGAAAIDIRGGRWLHICLRLASLGLIAIDANGCSPAAIALTLAAFWCRFVAEAEFLECSAADFRQRDCTNFMQTSTSVLLLYRQRPWITLPYASCWNADLWLHICSQEEDN